MAVESLHQFIVLTINSKIERITILGKTLHEMASDLKALIKDLNSDTHNSRSFRPEKYNNLKLVMDPQKDPNPHVVITISISEAKFNLNTLEKTTGSLGPDEKYVQRWFGKSSTSENLKECWKIAQSGKDKQAKQDEEVDE